MNANRTVAPFTNVAPNVYACTVVGYANSVMINNFRGLAMETNEDSSSRVPLRH